MRSEVRLRLCVERRPVCFAVQCAQCLRERYLSNKAPGGSQRNTSMAVFDTVPLSETPPQLHERLEGPPNLPASFVQNGASIGEGTW